MKTLLKNKIAVLLLMSTIFISCTETYNLKTDSYEEALVVEATITNELKKQEIKLTKTARLEEEGVQLETGANVVVTDNKGNSYHFTENSEKYISDSEFKAEPNTEYSLEITTKGGKKYQSSSEVLTTENQIENIVPKVVSTQEGEGVQISVESYDPTNTSKYYRYEYEETYKIIAPKWGDKKLIATGPQEIELIQSPLDIQICYGSKKSVDIIQTSTTNLQEDRVNFPVRFISDQDYIISHRYSILVRQYVQNLEAYTFYKTLKEISSSSSVLSPKQPGFVNGNIKCVTDTESKVIGFFDVSSVSSKRMFFNYADLYPGRPLPPYYVPCIDAEYRFCFGFGDPPCLGRQLITELNSYRLWYSYNTNDYYTMVPIECGDCTTFSSNVKPSFWTE
ncbi:DUF4249 domain-containing protein [Flavobacterium tyrosinilyticum]|uniref:DUF4249 domain-containing protein n=1 Tax=Flavobacterium tyrosinilyticum TaxID=1658740 RepID=UPI00202F814D|nr:DUF4249 domain-containing protein [Flavobacterium tyrosinilyticum]MCM0665019.1 DUF4249 domain-containing protein [Flavobacterium tyrosinilyticum]